jgi:hypothetical protein
MGVTRSTDGRGPSDGVDHAVRGRVDADEGARRKALLPRLGLRFRKQHPHQSDRQQHADAGEHQAGPPRDDRRGDVRTSAGGFLWSEGAREILAGQAGHGQDLVLAGNPLEGVDSPVLETEPRTGDQLGERPGGQDLGGSCQRGDPGPGVEDQASDLAVDHLSLSDVDAGTDVDTQGLHFPDDGPCAPEGGLGSVERGQDSVAGRVHLPAAVPAQGSSDDAMVPGHELPPAAIAQLRGDLRGPHDVREQHGDQRCGSPTGRHGGSVDQPA